MTMPENDLVGLKSIPIGGWPAPTVKAVMLASLTWELRKLADILEQSQHRVWDEERKELVLLSLEGIKVRIKDLKD